MGVSDFPDFEPTYKAELRMVSSLQKGNLSHYLNQDMDQAFEEIVTWCIKGETEKMKEACFDDSKPVYKDLIQSAHPKDDESGLNIREIVCVMGHVELMSFILQILEQPDFSCI